MSLGIQGFRVGTVYLVGGGPGAPGLVTARATQVLAAADVVVYDRLVSPRLLSFAPAAADFVYVGKEVGRHAMKQEAINTLLVDLALQGKQVVRLKGGDPFVFGRGGEEAQACHDAGVPFEIVPGVTSPVAVSAYAGIPVTHRGASTSFTVITGHQCEAGKAEDVDWQSLGAGTGTLVILMGISRLDSITQCLLSLGRKSDTPVALIRWGTRADQAVLTGTLGNICRRAVEALFQPPAIIVVGDVVNLRDTLNWFEHKPLAGRRVLVASDTRDQGRQMAESLESLGAETVDISVEQGTSANLMKLQQMLSRPVSTGASLMFRTVQAVHQFFAAFSRLNLDVRLLSNYQFGAMNQEAADALAMHHITLDFVGIPGLSGRSSAEANHWPHMKHVKSVGEPVPSDEDAARYDGDRVPFDPDAARYDGDVVRLDRDAAQYNGDVVCFDGATVTETYQLCNIGVDTPQLRAISDACETPFEVCWSTSTEASAFVQTLQTARGKDLVQHEVEYIQAATTDAFCNAVTGEAERHTMAALR